MTDLAKVKLKGSRCACLLLTDLVKIHACYSSIWTGNTIAAKLEEGKKKCLSDFCDFQGGKTTALKLEEDRKVCKTDDLGVSSTNDCNKAQGGQEDIMVLIFESLGWARRLR